MKYLLTSGMLAIFVVGSGPTFAEPWTSSCADAIGQLRRAQETVQAKQVEVEKAERGQRVQFQQAELCKPGGIIVGGKVAECVELSREVPIAIQALTDAQAEQQPAVDRFEEALEVVNERCRLRP